MCFLHGLELLSASCGFDSRWEHTRIATSHAKIGIMRIVRVYSQTSRVVPIFIGRQPATKKAEGLRGGMIATGMVFI